MAAPRRLVVDANVVIAGFLRDSTVRRLLRLSFLELMAPEFLLEEFAKHLPELRRRAALNPAIAGELAERLARLLILIPQDETVAAWDRAADAMASIDPRDVPYLAAALAVPCDGIWSDDPHMKKQTIVQCWTTKELVAALKKEGFDF